MDSWESWVKTFHVIAVISWMAGLLYLPRLFVYHSQYSNNSNEIAVFKVMERRLFKAIMNPALIAVWIMVQLSLMRMMNFIHLAICEIIISNFVDIISFLFG